MIISNTSVQNRVSVLVLSLIIVIFGVYCYKVLPRESFPDITIPNVFVSTNYKGVASKDIETSITIPIEKKLKGLENVKKIHSVSAEGLSQINIEFIPGTDIDEVLSKVKDKVDEAKGELPNDLEDEPVVFEVNFSELPIVVYSLSGTCGMRCLKDIADDLKEDIESIPGVLESEITGALDREIRVEIDPDKLAYYRIPITAFQEVVSSENQNTSGGTITIGDGRYQIRVPGEFKTPEEIYGLVVSSFEGGPVYLKDVATVVDGFKEEDSRSRLNGKSAINISVKKRTGENIIAVSDKIDEMIESRKILWPKGTEITKLMDQAKQIRNMVDDLENNIISGLVLVVVVLFFALGLRNAVLVALSIPFSMLLSFTVLYAFGITLNMVVLFSLTLALGMLVDNAIVIIENIYRYMEQGVSRIDAAMKATSEVAYPVIGSTLTTLAAFFPMIFWPGIMGEFMKYLPITLIITLSSSLAVALIINPAFAAFFMKTSSNSNSFEKSENTDLSMEKPADASKSIALKYYSAFLRSALNHRPSVLIMSFLVLIACIQLWLLRIGLEKPVEFFPSSDPTSAYINVTPPEGADLEYIDNVIKLIEMKTAGIIDVGQEINYSYNFTKHEKSNGSEFLGPSNLPNLEYIYSRAIENPQTGAFSENAPNHIGLQFIDFADRITPSALDLEKVRKRIKDIAGATITVDEAKEGPPTGAPINIEISGTDFTTLGTIAKKVSQIIAKNPYIEDIRDDYVEGIPTIQIRIDRQKAAMFGLSTSMIGFALKTAYNGLAVSTYREGDDDYDITVKLSEEHLKVTDVLHKLMIPAPSGTLVPLTSIADISYTGTIGNIIRINHERVITVRANVDEKKMPAATAREEAEKLITAFNAPPGYKIKFTGEKESQKESEEFLGKTFLIAILLIFLILVTLFNSVSQPLLIMTSVILSLGGAFLGLFVIKAPFGIIMTGVGVISLAGVVVNNAIVLIDYTNKLRDSGMSVKDAVISAGATRLRPVMLTAITTILGLIPMVTGISYDFKKMTWCFVSESTEFWRTMAIVVIFGLMISTFLTLVVVPVLYTVLESIHKRSLWLVFHIRRLYWKPVERFLN
ncbi:MAG: efflux RND transporter permease subunit [Desulfobacterales bacterium]|nr:efflux RND transporter permease subunit [Desulfobacterales bacterium]